MTEHLIVEEVGGMTVVRFLDLDRAVYNNNAIERIRRELQALVEHSPPRTIVLDFEMKEFVPYANFEAILVLLWKKLKESGGHLRMCNLPPLLIQQFKMNRLATIFAIFPTREDALRPIS